MGDKSDLVKKLRELCVTMIDTLNQLKANGKISEEEYREHTRNKKEFLSNTKDISE